MFHKEMAAAKAWGLTPDQWYDSTRGARAVMVAMGRADALIAHARGG